MSHTTRISHTRIYYSAQLGFTLIELMISLVLGLLISAAVIQVYIINTRTLTVQQSASEVQDSSIFALQALEDHIRIANLGNPITSINDVTAHGGIVLTANNIGDSSYNGVDNLTKSAASSGWTGLSNIDTVESDQLTIQYKNITPNILYDCEGTAIPATDTNWVIERYFIRATSTTVPDLALACDAGRATDAGTVSLLGVGSEIMIPAVDQFQVLLGVQTDVNNLTYLPAQTYLDLTDKPAINTVKIGVIVRSNTPLITDVDKTDFIVFGSEQTLKATTTKYYRRSYESTILLRNARVMSVTATAESVVPQ